MDNKKPKKEKEYWKSVDEKYQTEEYKKTMEKEFLSSPFASEDGSDGIARRDFLKLMGASLAMASTACVRRPAQYIVPYADQPPEITPGVANYYASSWLHQGETYGFIVKTREGRPIKVEGNPNHPINKNGLLAHAQAQILSLYDPDRLQSPLMKDASGNLSKTTWDDIDKEISGQIKAGKNLYILSSSLASPSTQAVISDFHSGVKGEHVVWDVLGADDVIEGQKASYGSSVLPRYRFDKARMIVSIDADFLGTWISPAGYSKLFAKGRKPGAEMNRLVVFESMMSLTGANSDVRIQIAPSQQLSAVMGILNELLNTQKVSRYANDSAIKQVVSQFAQAYQEMGIEKELLAQIAKDLWANKGRSLVVAGGLTTRTEQSKELQVAVNLLNSALENDGKTIDATNAPVTSYQGSYASIQNLIDKMNKGVVDILVIHKINPAYALPEGYGFREALKKVKTVIYKGTHLDETAKLATIVAPDHHHMENWGDNESQKGVYAIQQPTIRPLYDTRSFELDLITWAYETNKGPSRLRDVDSWYDYLKNHWKDIKQKEGIGGDFDTFWLNFLKTGVVDVSSRGGKRTTDAVERKFLTAAATSIKKKNKTDAIELLIYPKVGHVDGSFANVAWMMEFPDPITRMTWENYLNISVEMAKTLKLKDGDIVEIDVGGSKIKAPAHIQPGLHSKTVALATGFGRTDAGSVGSDRGVNAYHLVQVKNGTPIFSALDVKINPTGEKAELATIQEHHSMEGRDIIIQATLKEYLKNPASNIKKGHSISLWPKHKYKGYRWAMVIDQNACTGCGACVIACQSENNIPTVGKKYVMEGRIMHWMRIDRYYTGSESNPSTTTFQPVLCQHCENAPCETVCPVLATVHDDEGLNQMTYNRCVGTRYCANNCPYKVRRFNWFNYETGLKMPQTLALNPDVTVRTRGVMEKCTFCVQRLHEAKNVALDKGVKVQDGDVKTACQESCPTDAISFGNFADEKSEVSKAFKDPRSYALLDELNTVPMVRYQTRIKNIDQASTEEGETHG